jgi:hypothetical protein
MTPAVSVLFTCCAVGSLSIAALADTRSSPVSVWARGSPRTCANGVNLQAPAPCLTAGAFLLRSPAAPHDAPDQDAAVAALDGAMEFDAGSLPAAARVPQPAQDVDQPRLPPRRLRLIVFRSATTGAEAYQARTRDPGPQAVLPTPSGPKIFWA